jgi:hypothetical protein
MTIDELKKEVKELRLELKLLKERARLIAGIEAVQLDEKKEKAKRVPVEKTSDPVENKEDVLSYKKWCEIPLWEQMR